MECAHRKASEVRVLRACSRDIPVVSLAQSPPSRLPCGRRSSASVLSRLATAPRFVHLLALKCKNSARLGRKALEVLKVSICFGKFRFSGKWKLEPAKFNLDLDLRLLSLDHGPETCPHVVGDSRSASKITRRAVAGTTGDRT
eukprot:1073-Prymnesium_polylepis.2